MKNRPGVQHKKAITSEKPRSKVGDALSSMFKRALPDSAEKHRKAQEKHQELISHLATVKAQISAHDLDKFIERERKGVDDLLAGSSQSIVSTYSKTVHIANAEQVVTQCKSLANELEIWKKELQGKPELSTYPHKDLSKRITELDHKVKGTVKDLKAYHQQVVENFKSKIVASIQEHSAELERLNKLKELHRAQPTFVREAFSHLINHHQAQVSHLDHTSEIVNAHFSEKAEGKHKADSYSIEQLFAMINDVSLQEDKIARYNQQQSQKSQELDAALKEALEDGVPAQQMDAQWKKLTSLFTTQQIRNSNFMEAFEAKSKKQLQETWDAINAERHKIQEEMLANRKIKKHSAKDSAALLKRMETLEENYKNFKTDYRKAEHERRKASGVNLLVSELINTIDSGVNSNNKLDAAMIESWKEWKEKASILKEQYENLRVATAYEHDIPNVTPEGAEQLAKNFTAKKVDEGFGNAVLQMKLTRQQYKQLASSHDLTTFAGRFNNRMHRLFKGLNKLLNRSNEYSLTYFAAPAAIRVRRLEKQLEEAAKKEGGISHTPHSPRHSS